MSRKLYLLTVGVVCLLTVQAHAAPTISVQINSVSSAGSTPDQDNDTRHSFTTAGVVGDPLATAAAIVGTSVDVESRFAYGLEMRNIEGTGGTTDINYEANYTVLFEVETDPGVSWALQIENQRLGALRNEDDGGSGEVSLEASIATIGGLHDPNLDLPSAGSQSAPGTTNVSQTASTTLNGSGSQSFELNLTWEAIASSTQGFFQAGNQVALQLGIDADHPNVNLISYPRVGGEEPTDDGHFVSITATVTSTAIPEPSGLACLAIAATSCLTVRRRRK